MTKEDVIRRHEVMNSVLGILVIDEHLRRQFKETLSTLSSLKEEEQDREKLEALKECLENVELEPIEDEETCRIRFDVVDLNKAEKERQFRLRMWGY